MRVVRIAALGLLPLAAACWLERPNLQSTGGGYAAAATAVPPVDRGPAASVEHEEPAEGHPPTENAPAGS
ncbi:MAG TPA: hypothetical protein VFG78_01435 [Gemmatimonadota bacterium]|nr:hypothetical protein [Gemmatimonadota bacterium]